MNAILEAVSLNPVPPMVHKWGLHWPQPDPHALYWEATTVTLTPSQFRQLLDYSHSMPSGTYAGKMWKCHNDRTGVWFLCWYYDIPGTQEVIGIGQRPITFL